MSFRSQDLTCYVEVVCIHYHTCDQKGTWPCVIDTCTMLAQFLIRRISSKQIAIVPNTIWHCTTTTNSRSCLPFKDKISGACCSIQLRTFVYKIQSSKGLFICNETSPLMKGCVKSFRGNHLNKLLSGSRFHHLLLCFQMLDCNDVFKDANWDVDNHMSYSALKCNWISIWGARLRLISCHLFTLLQKLSYSHEWQQNKLWNYFEWLGEGFLHGELMKFSTSQSLWGQGSLQKSLIKQGRLRRIGNLKMKLPKQDIVRGFSTSNSFGQASLLLSNPLE